QEIQIEVGDVVNVLQPCRLVGLAPPRMLGHQHVEALRELLHERHDRRRAARAVQEEQRLAFSGAAQVRPAAVDLDEGIAEAHATLRFFSTPDSSIAAGISAKFIGAMTCAPATPGISASSRSTSAQMRRPSSFGSAALSSRSTIESGTMVP